MNNNTVNIIFRGHAFRPIIKKKTKKPKKHGVKWRKGIGNICQESIDNQIIILESIIKHIINPIIDNGYDICITGSIYSTDYNDVIINFFEKYSLKNNIDFVNPYPLQIKSAIKACSRPEFYNSYYNILMRLDQFFVKKIPTHFLKDTSNIYYLYFPDKKYTAIADQLHCIPGIYMENFINYLKDIKNHPMNTEDLSSLHFVHKRHSNIGYLFNKIELGNSNKRKGSDTDPFFFDLPKCKYDQRYSIYLN